MGNNFRKTVTESGTLPLDEKNKANGGESCGNGDSFVQFAPPRFQGNRIFARTSVIDKRILRGV